jgi:hypothetical protein
MGSITKRGLVLRAIVVLLALGVFVAFAGLAQAAYTGGVQDTGKFELDGNTLDTSCTLPTDWAGLYSANVANPCGSDGFSFVHDDIGGQNGTDKSYWQGGGSKDAYDPATGPWQWGPGDVSPDKNDIVNAFAAAYHLSDATSTTRFLFFGADRFTTNGDAQMGFWFLTSRVCLAGPVGTTTANGGAACPSSTPKQVANAGGFVDPTTGDPIHHKNGDILVLVNFNNGGTLGLAGVYEWTGATANGGGSAQQVVFGDGANCATIGDPNKFCSIANTANLAGEPVWPYTAKGTTGQATYAKSALIEGGINLSEIPGAGSCFPTFIAETRSSSGPSTGLSLQAQLKDLAMGQFQLCNSGTSTTPQRVTTSGNVAIGPDSQIPLSSGLQVKDEATVTVNGVDTWSGTVTFSLCGPTPLTDADYTLCTAPTASQQVGNPVPVSNTTPTVLSDAVTITQPGRYCFSAVFSGDALAGVPGSSDSRRTECFSVIQVPTTLATRQFVFPQDKASVGATAGGNLTGSIAFRLFGPTTGKTASENCLADNGTSTATGLLYSEAGSLHPISGASPQTATTNNTTYRITDSTTVYWHVIYDSTNDAQLDSDSCSESTAVTYTGNDANITIP